MVGSAAYWVAVAIGAVVCAVACAVARRHPGRPARVVGRAISAVLIADAVVFVLRPVVEGGWTLAGSLPLDLCDLALVIAAVACWSPRWTLGVELTWFWGMAGTLQAVATPDLSSSFPHPEFFQFVVGHLGIVIAALYLIAGLGLRPRSGSVIRIFTITAVYTAAVGAFDAATRANYMYLAHIPDHASLLSVLGPWPWYIVSAAGVAIVLLTLLDAPFRSRRRAPAERSDPAHHVRPAASGGHRGAGTPRRSTTSQR